MEGGAGVERRFYFVIMSKVFWAYHVKYVKKKGTIPNNNTNAGLTWEGGREGTGPRSSVRSIRPIIFEIQQLSLSPSSFASVRIPNSKFLLAGKAISRPTFPYPIPSHPSCARTHTICQNSTFVNKTYGGDGKRKGGAHFYFFSSPPLPPLQSPPKGMMERGKTKKGDGFFVSE